MIIAHPFICLLIFSFSLIPFQRFAQQSSFSPVRKNLSGQFLVMSEVCHSDVDGMASTLSNSHQKPKWYIFDYRPVVGYFLLKRQTVNGTSLKKNFLSSWPHLVWLTPGSGSLPASWLSWHNEESIRISTRSRHDPHYTKRMSICPSKLPSSLHCAKCAHLSKKKKNE